MLGQFEKNGLLPRRTSKRKSAGLSGRIFGLGWPLLFSWLALVGSVYAQEPVFDRVTLVGSALPGSRIINTSDIATTVNSIAVDAAGNSYVTGYFYGQVRLGSTTLVSVRFSNLSVDYKTLFVAKYDGAGNCLWAVQSGSSAGEGADIALDNSGNVYVTGYFIDPTAVIGNTTLTNAAPNATPNAPVNTNDVLVAKLDGNGNWLWARSAGGVGLDVGRAIAVDGAGNAYITGDYEASAAFGPTLLTNATSGGAYARRSDMFVASLDPQGNWRWALRGGSGAGCVGTDLALDGRGYLYVAGCTTTAATRVGPATVAVPGCFTARLATTGAWGWVTPSTGTEGVYGPYAPDRVVGNGPKVGVDAAGNVCVAGGFLGQATFGPYTLTSTGRYADAYVARLDANGAYRWATQAGGGETTRASGVALDERGNCRVVGTLGYNGSTAPNRFGPFSRPVARYSGFVALLNPAGDWQWVNQYDAPDYAVVSGDCLALGPGLSTYVGGGALISGITRTPIDFGNGLVLPPGTQSSFVARLAPYATLDLVGDSVLCGSGQVQLTARTTGTVQQYTWNTGATTASIAVAQPGTYTVVVTYAGGFRQTQRRRVRAVPTPAVQVAGPGTLCPGGQVLLLATATGSPRLRWNTGDTTARLVVRQPGTYTVVARYGAGCTAAATATVAADAVAIAGRSQLCPGQSTLLTATVAGAAATGYRWNTGATTPTLRVAQAGVYRVVASFADGCQLTATHPVGPPRAQVASVSGDTVLCPGTALTLTARNPDALRYTWSTGATTPTIAVAQPGRYGVTLTYEGGCTSADSLLVQAALPPPAFALGPDTTLCVEQTLLLQAPAAGSPSTARRWSDGSSGPTLRVREAGTYALEVRTPCGSRTATRRVAYASCFLSPNVITPNNDGLNERFVINELSRGPWRLEIYNRWGGQVYTTPDYRNTWGQEAAPGLYYYLLRPADGAPVQRGWLEVVR